MKKTIIAFILSISIAVSSFGSPVFASESVSSKESITSIKQLSTNQKNSIALLNYLMVLTQEINSSQNNKLYLEGVFSSIVNNTNIDVIDSASKDEIDMLLDTIEGYEMIKEKRDRINYIYEQNQAATILKSIPNPLGMVSAATSGSKLKLLASVVYMAIDGLDSYKKAASEADLKYLEDNWELDADAKKNLNDSRSDAFDYMIELCHENNIPGAFALKEDDVKRFVKWENTENATRRIEFLIDNQETYQAYGKYWLVLAKSYYDLGEKENEKDYYTKCLESIEKYIDMNIKTFNKDHELAKTLAIGLSAARESLSDPAYVYRANKYCELIEGNIEPEDWTLRYLLAQTYIELGDLIKDESQKYYNKAFKLTKENINYLIDYQIEKNDRYRADLEEIPINKGDTSEKKREIKAYNKCLREEREKELPPVYQPLVLNCELLVSLSKKLNISDSDKKNIDKMLHPQNKVLFLNSSLDKKYWLYGTKEEQHVSDPIFKKNKIYIPATYLSDNAQIKVSVSDNGTTKSYDDWTLEEVKRDKEEPHSENKYMAIYKSKDIGEQDYGKDTIIVISIIPPIDCSFETKTIRFKIENYKKIGLFEDFDFVLDK